MQQLRAAGIGARVATCHRSPDHADLPGGLFLLHPQLGAAILQQGVFNGPIFVH